MKYKHLSIEERENIQKLLWEKRSIRAIAKELGRSPSSISREVEHNKPPERVLYAPRLAHERALKHRKRRGREKRLKNDTVRSYVVERLKTGWSPEQIAGYLPTDYPEETISHEAIYQYVYAQIHRHGHGEVKPGREDLRSYLKRRHKRRIKHGVRKGERVCKPKGPSIEERPLVAEERSRIGDWEGDTIASKNNMPGINSLVERKTGLVFLTKLKDKTAEATTGVVVKRLQGEPAHTLTVDNGSENQDWRCIEEKTDVNVFFAHPYSSWERGTNENTNGLVRWYFPKGTDFRTIPEKLIMEVENALNNRPRKRLGWRTPLEVYQKHKRQSVALQS